MCIALRSLLLTFAVGMLAMWPGTLGAQQAPGSGVQGIVI